MRIGIIADSHDRMDMISKAVELFKARAVEVIIHCGDFVSPFAMRPYMDLKGRFIAVLGNNEGEFVLLSKIIKSFGELHSAPHLEIIDEKRFLISHEPMKDKQLLQYQPPLDYFIYGHTHEPEYRELNGIKIINPGECCGWLTAKSTVGILDLATSKYEQIELK